MSVKAFLRKHSRLHFSSRWRTIEAVVNTLPCLLCAVVDAPVVTSLFLPGELL